MRNHLPHLTGAGALMLLLCAPPRAAADATQQPSSSAQAEQKADKHLEKMKKKLGLTDEQAAKLKEVWKEKRESVKPARERLKKALEQLRAQVDKKASEADIQASLDEVRASRKELQARREKAMERMDAILTPTQRAKLLLHAMKKRRHMFGWMRRKREGGSGGDD